jgi:hypothetical protein
VAPRRQVASPSASGGSLTQLQHGPIDELRGTVRAVCARAIPAYEGKVPENGKMSQLRALVPAQARRPRRIAAAGPITHCYTAGEAQYEVRPYGYVRRSQHPAEQC